MAAKSKSSTKPTSKSTKSKGVSSKSTKRTTTTKKPAKTAQTARTTSKPVTPIKMDVPKMTPVSKPKPPAPAISKPSLPQPDVVSSYPSRFDSASDMYPVPPPRQRQSNVLLYILFFMSLGLVLGVVYVIIKEKNLLWFKENATEASKTEKNTGQRRMERSSGESGLGKVGVGLIIAFVVLVILGSFWVSYSHTRTNVGRKVSRFARMMH